jgi:hypothetical protein
VAKPGRQLAVSAITVLRKHVFGIRVCRQAGATDEGPRPD